MDEEDTPKPPRRPSPSQLSRTPSWIMLGFILGVLFVLALPRREPPPRPVVAAPTPPPPRRTEPPQLTTVETLFAQWSRYAVWDNDVTQIALWDPAVGAFSDYYEVRRIDGHAYFRSIPRLTNRIIRHGPQPPSACPIRFTETEGQYREWRDEGRFERPDTSVPAIEPPAYMPAVPRPTSSVTPVQPPVGGQPAVTPHP